MIVNLANPMGQVRRAKVGFSWTVLFFGFFVPIFRGDIKCLLIMLLLDAISCGSVNFLLSFFYNGIYIRDLLSKGYYPADTYSKSVLVAKRFII